MITPFSVLSVLTAFSGPCLDVDISQIGSAASAALQEAAEERGVSEPMVGAVLLLMRQEACDILEAQPLLFESTQKAIEAECSRIELLSGSSEADYLAAAVKPIAETSPSAIAMVWAVANDAGSVQHVLLVSDGAQALRMVYPGFAREGPSQSSCSQNPFSQTVPSGDGG